MPSQGQLERAYDIEGQEVRCIELDGDPLWHCGCPKFQERLSRFSEGFCGHTVVAMMRWLEEARTAQKGR